MTTQENISDDIDIVEIFKILWTGKYYILIITIIFGICSIIYAKSLPNIYKSEVLLAPVAEDNNSMGGLSQLGGLASLAGINVGGGGSNVSKTSLAIEILKSREFISKFIEDHNLLPVLFAVKSWHLNEPIYDKNIFDIKNNSWVKNTNLPSILSACGRIQSVLSVQINNKTRMIKVSIEHKSPEIARQWVTWLIEDINLMMKNRDMKEAQDSISYLDDQLKKTELLDIRYSLNKLIEEQIKMMMLVKIRREYIFKTIDSAVAPELRSKPNRSNIVFAGVLMGVMLSFALVFFNYFYLNKRK